MGTKTWYLLSGAIVFMVACANTNCRTVREQERQKNPSLETAVAEVSSMKTTSNVDRMKVFKADGSLQCGQGKALSPKEMKAQLQGLMVHQSWSKNDGLMRIQQCGQPTGNCNVFEINRVDLAKAQALGFEEWTQD